MERSRAVLLLAGLLAVAGIVVEVQDGESAVCVGQSMTSTTVSSCTVDDPVWPTVLLGAAVVVASAATFLHRHG